MSIAQMLDPFTPVLKRACPWTRGRLGLPRSYRPFSPAGHRWGAGWPDHGRTGRDDVNRHPGIKQQGFVRATEIMEPQSREP
jgi:hypothetical protein